MTPRLNKAAWVMTAIYTALLTTASLLPSGQGLLGGWDASISPDLQDALHVPAYASLVVLWTLAYSTRSPLSTRSIFAVTCACVAFGAAMELAQSVIPGRTCSLNDGLVNIAGTLVGCLVFLGIFRRGQGRNPPGTTAEDLQRERCRAMVREHYYKRGWKGPYKEYEALLGRVVRKTQVVLDVGCGRDFPVAPYLLRLGAEVHGIDPVADPTAAPPGVSVSKGSAESIPYPADSFDVVTSRCVFEHLEHPEAVFKEIHRVLKPGGYLIFLTPSKYDYISVAARIIPNSLHGRIIHRLEGRDEHDTFPTFYRANSAGAIERLAMATGFKVDEVGYLNQYPYLLMFSPLLCRIAIAYDEAIRHRRCLHALQAWVLGLLRRA